ncbi:MAG: quinolinate synthase NadA [Planctomycetia bacterium]|nr:quinolinate synthase NadA [Planctomycetia bacterium]
MRPSSIESFQEIRKQWGNRLLILGHYYVPDETLALTDRQGDSLALARFAQSNDDCRAIVFCGVHFMAETADILANAPEKIQARGGVRIPVILPEMGAGCPMADMASRPQVEACWETLESLFVADREITPVTYVNSSADIKAFCGRHGGVVCTSSNARQVLEWALSRRPRVLFLPDQHLGRNTAIQMGYTPADMVLWNRETGATPDALKTAKFILWDGYCPVHHQMTPEMVDASCTMLPNAKLVVHPECRQEVVSQSFGNGSTSYLISAIQKAPAGDAYIVGTEAHLVNRLRAEHPELTIHHLGQEHVCEDMARNTRDALFAAVENLNAATPTHLVAVPDAVAADARIALENMLRLN